MNNSGQPYTCGVVKRQSQFDTSIIQLSYNTTLQGGIRCPNRCMQAHKPSYAHTHTHIANTSTHTYTWHTHTHTHTNQPLKPPVPPKGVPTVARPLVSLAHTAGLGWGPQSACIPAFHNNAPLRKLQRQL